MTLHIGLLVFPKVQQLDLTGPYDVFASLPGVVVHLVWKNLDPLLSSTGLGSIPTPPGTQITSRSGQLSKV